MENRDDSSKVNVLEAQVAALNDLLTLRGKALSDQSARLEQTLLELRRAQSQWLETLDAIEDMVFIIGKDHRIVAANRAACKAFAGTEVIGAYCYKLVHGTGAPLPACPSQGTFSTKQPAHAEFCEPHLGSRWLDIYTSPIAGNDGTVEQVVHVVRDVTERERMKEQIRERMKELQAFFSLAEITEQEGITLDRLYEECANILPISWLHADIAYARIVIGDSEFRTKNFAESKWMQSAPVKVGKTIVGRIDVGYLEERPEQDEGPFLKEERRLIDAIAERLGRITERKRADEALAESEKGLRDIFEKAADGILIADVDGKRFSGCNPTICQMLGYTPEEIVTLGIPDIHPEKDLPYVRDQVEKQTRREITLAKDLPVKRKDGTVFYADVSAVPMMLRGRECLVGFFRDITDRKRTQEKLKLYAAELEHANEDVRQFAYIVSHDLRTPLVNLKGFAAEIRSSLEVFDVALAAALPHLSEEQRDAAIAALKKDMPEALDFIDSSVTRMDGFISALLKLSRIGHRELHFERLNVADIVQAVVKGLAHQIAERSTTVMVGSLPDVVADRTAMEQIMGNILANAVLYLDPSRPGKIEISGRRGPEETLFFVRDNGRGIANDDMPKVFAPFRRAGRQDVKGEGMGLAYVQALVRRHGGQIRCESELGVGTTFTFTLRNPVEQGGHDARAAAT